jgi:hypothetical protein
MVPWLSAIGYQLSVVSRRFGIFVTLHGWRADEPPIRSHVTADSQ